MTYRESHDNHRSTILVLLAIIPILFLVPQLYHLFEPNGGQIVWFIIYVLTLLVAYAAAALWIVPSIAPPADPLWPSIQFATAHQRRLRFASLVLTFLCFIAFAARYSEIWPVGVGPMVLSFGCILGAFTVVLFAWNRLSLRIQLLFLRLFVVFMVANGVGELIWYGSLVGGSLPLNYYSVWAVFHTFFCAIAVARVIDFSQMCVHFPIRLLVVVGAALVCWLVTYFAPSSAGQIVSYQSVYLNPSVLPADLREPAGDRPADDTSGRLKPSDMWLVWLKRRLDAIPADGPVVLVAASGGGSRAALFTALVYEDLALFPIPRDGTPPYDIAKHILLISSVSGGALASACYVDPEHRLKRAEWERRKYKPVNSDVPYITALMNASWNSVKGWTWYRGIVVRNGQRERVDFGQIAQDAFKKKAPGWDWFFHRAFVDDMCTDFMAPLLRGMLYLEQDRARAVQQYWQGRFGLRLTNLESQRTRDSTLPLLFCNISDVEQGTCLIAGFPPLPPKFCEVADFEAPGYQPRDITDIDPTRQKCVELNLAEAVRLSANFPWGFPVAHIPVPQPAAEGRTGRPDVHLIDGGVVDNTGIDALRAAFSGLRERAYGDSPQTLFLFEPEVPTPESLSRSIVRELSRRGVLVLEIDSGLKPEPAAWLGKVFAGIVEPISSLENGSYATAASSASDHVVLLDEYLSNPVWEQLGHRVSVLRTAAGESTATGFKRIHPLRNVRRLTITCNHQDNVITAWALSARDKAQIFLRFVVGRLKLRADLEDYFRERAFVDRNIESLSKVVRKMESGKPDPREVEAVADAFRRLLRLSTIPQGILDDVARAEKKFYQGVFPGAEAQKALADFDANILARQQKATELRAQVGKEIQKLSSQ